MLFSCTKPMELKLTTDPVTNVTFNSAKFVGHVVFTDNVGIETKELGFCYSETQNPTISDFKVKGDVMSSDYISKSASSEIVAEVNNLKINTSYYVCTYCILSTDQVLYGNQQSFTTLNGGVKITTIVSNTTMTSAICGGNMECVGKEVAITELGVLYSLEPNIPNSGTNKVVCSNHQSSSFSCELLELMPNATYYVQAYALSVDGRFYGQEEKFMTTNGVKLSVSEIKDLSWLTATCGGRVEDDGGMEILELGLCYSISENPTISNVKFVSTAYDESSFVCYLQNLTPNKRGYLRAYAITKEGVFYSEQKTFTPSLSERRNYRDLNSKDWGEAIYIGGDWDNDPSTPNTVLCWAPVNCGCEDNNRVGINDHLLGKIYQWGAGDSSLYYSADGYRYDALEMYANESPYSNWLGFNIICGSDSDRWNDDFGPCPAGWRLPTKTEFEVLIAGKNNDYGYASLDGFDREFFGANADKKPGTGVLFPAIYSRDPRDGSNGALEVYYWSSNVYNEYRSWALLGNECEVVVRAMPAAVRCVIDTYSNDDHPYADTKHKGTLEDPYTVSDAIAKCQETGSSSTSEVYYVKGTVLSVDESGIAQYGNITLDLVDEGTTAVFKAYRIKSEGGVAFTSAGNTKVGDVVVVKGRLINYSNKIPETSQNTGELVSVNGKFVAKPSIDVKTVTTINYDVLESVIAFTVAHPVADQKVTIANIKDGGVATVILGNSSVIVIFAEANMTDSAKEVSFTLKYLDAEDVVCTVIQKVKAKSGDQSALESTLTYTKGTNSYDDGLATINDIENVKVFKLGTSKAAGDCQFTVPTGTTKIGFYAVGWKGSTGTVLKVGDKSVSVDGNDGATANAPYYITLGDLSDAYFIVDVSPGEVKFSCDKRVIIWGLNPVK